MTDTLFRALATLTLHSVLLCALALLVSRWIRVPAWRSQVLRAGVLGALLTTAIQLSTGIGTSVGPMADRAPIPVEIAAAQPPLQAASSLPGALEPAAGQVLGAQAAEPSSTPPGVNAGTLLLSAWAALALFGLARLALARRRFISSLKRTDVRSESQLPASIRLTQSAFVTSPVALSAREICIPTQGWSSHSTDEQAAMLAHEVAHIERADPTWRIAMAAFASLLFFQPLLRLAMRREAAAAEFDCDDRASGQTHNPLALARAMARLAETAAPKVSAPIPSMVPAMATVTSDIVGRVERLVGARPQGPGKSSSRLFAATVGLALTAVACSAPRVGASLAEVETVKTITLEFADKGIASLYAPGESEPRGTFDINKREGKKQLRALLVEVKNDAALDLPLGAPDYAEGTASPAGGLTSARLLLRMKGSTPFKFVQWSMEGAAAPEAQFWNIAVENSEEPGVIYPIPLPFDMGVQADGVIWNKISLRIDPTGPGNPPTIVASSRESASPLYVPEEIEEEEPIVTEIEGPEDPVHEEVLDKRLTRLNGSDEGAEFLLSTVRSLPEGTPSLISIDPRKGTTLAEVTPLLRAAQSFGAAAPMITIMGSFER